MKIKRLRQKAITLDVIVSAVIGILIMMVLNIEGVFCNIFGAVEFGLFAFFWIAAYDPILHLGRKKKKGGFVDDAEMD